MIELWDLINNGLNLYILYVHIGNVDSTVVNLDGSYVVGNIRVGSKQTLYTQQKQIM